MTSKLSLTSAYRGGRHGEAPASHDGEKKQREGEACTNEGQEDGPQFVADETASFEDRPSQLGDEDACKAAPTDGGQGMTDSTSNLPKTGGQAAQVIGKLFNDTRITNVLMLVLVLIGMGGAEAVQTQMCSL